MGRTYEVPRNVKGEGRFLYIFSMRSLATTLVGGFCGLPLYFIIGKLGMPIGGLIAVVVMAALGFGIGTLTIPDTPMFGNLRKAGGEPVLEILLRTATFGTRKKVYLYRPAKDIVSETISIDINKILYPTSKKTEDKGGAE